jgi:uncharacterized protein YdhG (YjbR/CyaY superfamily)
VAPSSGVEEYIATARRGAQSRLRELRAAIRDAAPHADESLSYGRPFYSYKGKVGIQRRLCYFGLLNSGIGFYMRPKDLDPHEAEVTKFRRTKSALFFSLDTPIPVTLITRLVADAVERADSLPSVPSSKEKH